MEAGRELDALVAERVFNLMPIRRVIREGYYEMEPELIDVDDEERDPAFTYVSELVLLGEKDAWQQVPRYSTNIAAAWQVVEHMLTCGVRVEVGSLHGGEFSARASEPAGSAYTGIAKSATAATGSLAICCAVVELVNERERRSAMWPSRAKPN